MDQSNGDLHGRLLKEILSGASAKTAADALIHEGWSRELVQDAVQAIHNLPFFRLAAQRLIRLRCREWWLSTQASLSQLQGSDLASIAHPESVGRQQFFDNYYIRNRPLLLSGRAKAWPATQKWNRQYLDQLCGQTSIEVMGNRNGSPVWKRNTGRDLCRTMTLSAFMDLVYEGGPTNDYYMVSRNRFFENAETRRLLDDLGTLEFVDTQAQGDGIKMWFGPAGTRTPLHYDDKNNVIAQIVGRKQVRLIAPVWSEYMDQVQPWYARVDPGAYPADAFRPPEWTVILNPGDVLFIPVGWWHALDADDVSITLAFIDFGVPNNYAFSAVQPEPLSAILAQAQEIS